MKKPKKSDKELDLIDLGLSDVYRACYCFAFSGLSLCSGLALACTSRLYEALAPFLSFLLIGLALVACSLTLAIFGFLFFKKKGAALDNPELRCPIVEKRIIRNGFIGGGVLSGIGFATMVLGLTFFPQKPIHGTALFVASMVALLYGSLLFIATIRDKMIANKAKR